MSKEIRHFRHFFILLNPAGKFATLVLNQNAKTNENEKKLCSFQNLKGRGCTGCTLKVLLLMHLYAIYPKAFNLPVSKVRQFLHSKTSFTNFTLAAQRIKRMNVFVWFKNEIWRVDLDFVDKLAKENDGVKYLLVRQALFG